MSFQDGLTVESFHISNYALLLGLVIGLLFAGLLFAALYFQAKQQIADLDKTLVAEKQSRVADNERKETSWKRKDQELSDCRNQHKAELEDQREYLENQLATIRDGRDNALEAKELENELLTKELNEQDALLQVIEQTIPEGYMVAQILLAVPQAKPMMLATLGLEAMRSDEV